MSWQLTCFVRGVLPGQSTHSPSRRILVVDDAPNALELLVNCLEGSGYQTCAAESGHGAIELAGKFSPDLVILDVQLPDLDGREVCRLLKKQSGPVFLPVVLLTARGDLHSKLEGFSAGADDYLTKPYVLAELLARIRVMLRLRDAQSTIVHLQTRRDEYLNIVSHDLKLPVATILGYGRYLLDQPEPLSAPNAEIVKRMIATAEFMNGMIAYFLGRALTEKGEIELYPSKVYPDRLLKENVRRNSVVASGRKIAMTCEASEKLPPLFADENKLQQVLNNLIGNAIKFSPEGGTIAVTGATGEGELLIGVTDEGPGIPEEDRLRIFEESQRRRARPSRPGAETGLGLLISKQIVELHGGRIWVEPSARGGASFRVSLPLQPTWGSGRS